MNVDEVVAIVVETLEHEGAGATVTVAAPGVSAPGAVTVAPERAHGAPLRIVVGDRLTVTAGVGVRVRLDTLDDLSGLVKTVAGGRLTERLATRNGRTVSRGAASGDPLRVLGVTASRDRLFGSKTTKVTYPAYPPGRVVAPAQGGPAQPGG